MRDPRYDCLFEPIRLGPVTVPNRFYQVPHCSGMGWKRPRMLAAMRGIKAEGGWGVVCTEYCSVHPTSDDGAYPFARLWDADDIRDHALMTEAVHAHGALAGVELWLGGSFIANLETRVPPLGVISRPPTNVDVYHPGQSRRLDKSDIADIRRWQAEAARRAAGAGSHRRGRSRRTGGGQDPGCAGLRGDAGGGDEGGGRSRGPGEPSARPERMDPGP